MEIWREVGDKLSIGQGLGPLAGRARDRQHDYVLAEKVFNESLALFREVGNEREIAGAYWNSVRLRLPAVIMRATRKLAEESSRSIAAWRINMASRLPCRVQHRSP